MSVSLRRLPLQGPSIANAFSEDFPTVQEFYTAGPPTDPASYARVAELIHAGWDESRWEAFSDLLEFAGPETGKRLQRLMRGRGLFVATGQQAGLFGGPLLTLYKAFTAERLAQQLEEQLDLPVLPLFTVASEDHDWREVNHTYVIDVGNELVRIAVGEAEGEHPTTPHPPVWRIRVEADIESALELLSDSMPDTEFKAAALDPLRDAYRVGGNYADAFAQTLRRLLRRRPFLVLPISHPFVKRASRELLWREWELRGESLRRLRARADALQAAGFDVQVPIPEGATNLFLEGRLGRDRLLDADSAGRLRRSGERLTEDELRGVIEHNTERVSPGALLRPVAEAKAFPVVAHVVGASEIAYLAESQVLYDLHEVPAPLVVPRTSLQIVEPKIGRMLEKYGLEAGDLGVDARRVIGRLLADMAPAELQVSLEGLRTRVSEALAAVESAALSFDPGSQSALGSGEKAIMDSIKSLESKLEARVREKHQVQKRQLEKAALHLYPEGAPQERMLNIHGYLVRYGESLLDEISSSVVTPLD